MPAFRAAPDVILMDVAMPNGRRRGDPHIRAEPDIPDSRYCPWRGSGTPSIIEQLLAVPFIQRSPQRCLPPYPGRPYSGDRSLVQTVPVCFSSDHHGSKGVSWALQSVWTSSAPSGAARGCGCHKAQPGRGRGGRQPCERAGYLPSTHTDNPRARVIVISAMIRRCITGLWRQAHRVSFTRPPTRRLSRLSAGLTRWRAIGPTSSVRSLVQRGRERHRNSGPTASGKSFAVRSRVADIVLAASEEWHRHPRLNSLSTITSATAIFSSRVPR
jgi:hypothetical protein